jgi:hypothetical protein
VTFGHVFQHRCTIRRGTQSRYDASSLAAAHLTNAPCRFWEEASREALENGQTVIVRTSTLLIGLDADVQPQDLVTAIVDWQGNALISRAYSVDGPPIRYPAFQQVNLVGS